MNALLSDIHCPIYSVFKVDKFQVNESNIETEGCSIEGAMPPRPNWSVNKENIILNSTDLKSVADFDDEIARIEGNIIIDIPTCNAEIEQVFKTVESILVSAYK